MRSEILQIHEINTGKHGDAEVAATQITEILYETLTTGLNEMYPSIVIDSWVIMPNHIHLIVGFENTNLGKIIKSFKGFTQKQIVAATSASPLLQDYFVSRQINYHKIWQKSFHDRIIWNQKEYDILTQYIHDNPILWDQDSLNPLNGVIEDTKTE